MSTINYNFDYDGFAKQAKGITNPLLETIYKQVIKLLKNPNNYQELRQGYEKKLNAYLGYLDSFSNDLRKWETIAFINSCINQPPIATPEPMYNHHPFYLTIGYLKEEIYLLIYRLSVVAMRIGLVSDNNMTIDENEDYVFNRERLVLVKA